jgi:glycosyltransferase involved in cell wall biosynthesis
MAAPYVQPPSAPALRTAERPLRIALVVPGGVDESGERRVIPVLLALIERLARRHHVHVFALRQDEEPREYRLLGARVSNLGRPKCLSALPGRAPWWRYRALARMMRSERFDVVHAFWASEPGAIATAAADQRRIPTLVSLAGGELVGLREIGYGGGLSLRQRWLTGFALRRATIVTCASGPMEALSVAAGRTPLRVPLGMALPPEAEQVVHAVGPPRLLFVGSLNRVKDPFTLLAALRRVVTAEPEARLDVIGVDTLGSAVHRRAAALGLDAHVRFHGFVPSAELARFYRAAHVLVVSSRHEAGPVVALEAAGWGVPTVGTHVGHLADAAGDWAETVAVGDAAALAEAVLALGRDRDRRASMGASARAWARANDADATAARFETIYRRLVAGSRADRDRRRIASR